MKKITVVTSRGGYEDVIKAIGHNTKIVEVKEVGCCIVLNITTDIQDDEIFADIFLDAYIDAYEPSRDTYVDIEYVDAGWFADDEIERFIKNFNPAAVWNMIED